MAVLLTVATLGWWLLPIKNELHRGDLSSAPAVQTQTQTLAGETSHTPGQLLRSAANDLGTAHTPAEKNLALARLRDALTAGSTNEMSAAIRQWLDMQADAGTGQGFKIGRNGFLTEAPTLRTLLLDRLAAIDPEAAAVYARQILGSSSSPDEWAIAMRSLAHGDTGAEARDLLETRMTQLLRNESWQHDPSAGYLEAFDTAVYLGGTDLLSPLANLVRTTNNQAIAHAAFLTLDRLVINQPAATLAALAEHPEWMTGREETRANYFARADVGDPVQRRLVETYLLDTTHGPAELQAFAGIFPNANFMISNNLLTSNPTLAHAALVQRDQASLYAVNAWLADPRFANLRPLLLNMRARLEGFLK